MRLRPRILLLSAALSLSGLSATSALAKSAAEWLALTGAVQIGLSQAVEKAQAVAPGKAIDVELEEGKKGAAPYYSVTLISPVNEEIKLRVNASTGDAAVEKNKGQAEAKHVKRLADARITLVQAVDAAIAALPGKPLEAQLDSDWGKTSYKVKMLRADQTVMKLRLDPVSGAVTGQEKD